MQIDISGRHFKVTDGIRNHVMQKIGKIEKFGLKIETCHVVFELQKITHTCEIILSGKNLRINALEKTSDMYASFDTAVATLLKQLQRYHERIKDHRLREKELPEIQETPEN